MSHLATRQGEMSLKATIRCRGRRQPFSLQPEYVNRLHST